MGSAFNFIRLTLIVTGLAFLLNLVGYMIAEIGSVAINEYSIYDYTLASIEYGVIILVFSLLFRGRYIVISFPVLWAVLSIAVVAWNYMSGYEFIILCNSGWSRLYFITYTALAYPGMSQLGDAALMIGLFFLYQVGLLYVSQRINQRWQLKSKRASANVP
jgi:hypothetical protein